MRLLWGETAAWPSVFQSLPDGPVMWVGKTTEMAGNFAVVIPSEGLTPSDPPLPVTIGPTDSTLSHPFCLALCPEKYFALRDGLRDMPEWMAVTSSSFWIAKCVCVCVWAVSKDVKLVSSHIILQGATGEVYSQWPTKTLYTSCVNVPALVLTVDLRFC